MNDDTRPRSARRTVGGHDPARRRRVIGSLTFWTGAAMVAAGVALHLGDFAAAASNGYRMKGMGFSPLMSVGMLLLVAGLAAAVVAILVSSPVHRHRTPRQVPLDDERSLKLGDLGLLAVMLFGLVIDVMKPATIGFVLPGARAEYGLSILQVSAWPLVALTGTVLGSIVWGAVADRFGRRVAVLMAGLLFAATSACGVMPIYGLNLVMCLFMGASAGGFLPIAFTVITESIPRRHRGWIAVLVGSVGGTLGYLAAAGAAATLAPHFSWRVLWLLGLPTGAAMITLSWFVPESPRFLLGLGGPAPAPAAAGGAHRARRISELPPGYRSLTLILVLFAMSWGLINFGFLTWLPSILAEGRAAARVATSVLAQSALLAVPAAVICALLYGRWSSTRSLTLFGLATALALSGIGLLFLSPSADAWALRALLIVLLVGVSGCSAMLAVYAAEVYPTAIRATGSGVVSAAMKFGGVFGPPVVALLVFSGPGITLSAVIVALIFGAAALFVLVPGLETTGRSLEEIAHQRR